METGTMEVVTGERWLNKQQASERTGHSRWVIDRMVRLQLVRFRQIPGGRCEVSEQDLERVLREAVREPARTMELTEPATTQAGD